MGVHLPAATAAAATNDILLAAKFPTEAIAMAWSAATLVHEENLSM